MIEAFLEIFILSVRLEFKNAYRSKDASPEKRNRLEITDSCNCCIQLRLLLYCLCQYACSGVDRQESATSTWGKCRGGNWKQWLVSELGSRVSGKLGQVSEIQSCKSAWPFASSEKQAQPFPRDARRTAEPHWSCPWTVLEVRIISLSIIVMW